MARHVKPIRLTFYDVLEVRPYTTTLYVCEDASLARVKALIAAIQDLSNCVLGKYTVGSHTVDVPDYVDQIRAQTRNYEGTARWRIKVFSSQGAAYTFSIPGRDPATRLKATRGEPVPVGDLPDIEHPRWIKLREILAEIGITKDGQPLTEKIKGNVSIGNWPPKGWKKYKKT